MCSFNRTLLAFRVSFGRIGALPSYPVQIKSKELNGLLTFPIKESAIVTWLQSKISGFNFQLVTCVNDEQHVEEYLQFRISAATPDSFPNHYSLMVLISGLTMPYHMPRLSRQTQDEIWGR